MRLPLSSSHTENAWIANDRRERLKFAAATLALFGSAFGGLLFVAYTLYAS
ncbi:hypothetical protein [Oleiharenicola sp. Vm1]|uniref:hypothetical protein n=1 Tax=Oleiharenicola sp. Vm1 TaxID=3398393 RepID=UPI0039F4C45C